MTQPGHDLLDFRLAAIQKPTLIVWGREDRLIPLWTGEKMHRQIAGSVLFVVDGCGHLAPSQCVPPIVQETIAFFTASPVLPPGESSAPHPRHPVAQILHSSTRLVRPERFSLGCSSLGCSSSPLSAEGATYMPTTAVRGKPL